MLPKSSENFNNPKTTTTTSTNYTEIKLVSQSAYSRTSIAKLCDSQRSHMIRELDHLTQAARQFFCQELLHLCAVRPKVVLIESFRIHHSGQKALYATLPYRALTESKHKKIVDPEEPKYIEKVIKNVALDMLFLGINLEQSKIAETLGPESIFYIEDRDTYILGNWPKFSEKCLSRSETSPLIANDQEMLPPRTEKEILEEIYKLRMMISNEKRSEPEAVTKYHGFDNQMLEIAGIIT